MTYGIDGPRSKRSAAVKRGSDVSFFSDSYTALNRFGRNHGNRIDDFRFETPSEIYGPYELATSFPYLSHALSAVCSEILNDQTIPYSRATAAFAWEHLNLRENEWVNQLRMDLHSGTYVRKEPDLIKMLKEKYRDDYPLIIEMIWNAKKTDLLKDSCFEQKKDGSRGEVLTRTIVSDSIEHRVICRATNTVALTFAASRMGPGVIGCMPGIGMPEIIKGFKAAAAESGRSIALCFDVSGFFDNVLVERAMKYCRRMLGYDPASAFGAHFERFALGDIPAQRGLPQGNALSPLIANIYATEAIDPEARNWGPYFRYVDDGLVLCYSFSHAQEAYAAIAERADGFGLKLHPHKTEIYDLRTSKKVTPKSYREYRGAKA